MCDIIEGDMTEEEEDILLAKIADEAYEEYLKNPKTYTLEELEKELGF